MSRPRVLDIADAVVTELNTPGNYTGSIVINGEASRGWVPRFDHGSLSKLQVLVAPTAESSQEPLFPGRNVDVFQENESVDPAKPGDSPRLVAYSTTSH